MDDSPWSLERAIKEEREESRCLPNREEELLESEKWAAVWRGGSLFGHL